MSNVKMHYDELLRKKEEAYSKLQIFNEIDIIKTYKKIIDKISLIEKEEKILYPYIKFEEYNNCNHLWVPSFVDHDTKNNNTDYYYGCLKCGLDTSVILNTTEFYDMLSQNEKIQIDYIYKYENNISHGTHLDLPIGFNLVRSIYFKILNKNPKIDEETAIHYLFVAVNNIINKKFNLYDNIDLTKKINKSKGLRRNKK